MIITAGYNVGGPEVEAVIDTHPEVLESAVVARPDAEKGAIVNAFVVLRPGVSGDDATAESIRELVRSKIAGYKVPRRIDFIDALPRNPSGKLQHFKLRERAAAEAAAEAGAEAGAPTSPAGAEGSAG
jgi:2-aminobenzoate-CoA ligase